MTSKTLRIAMAAVTASAAVLSAAAPASAKGHNWKHHHNDDNDGEVAAAAVVAGVLGLAIGAAIMSSKRTPVVHTVQRGDFVSLPAVDTETYAPPAEAAAAEPRTCSRGDWVWDRFETRYNWVITTVPC